VFFANHDPTTMNSQGPDFGTQYRSAIFAATPEQKQQAEAYIKTLQASPQFLKRKIVTTVQMAPPFYPAEDYHQDYHAKHGGSCKVK
jgi:peptide-methionine (S)-S-oxide reductase